MMDLGVTISLYNAEFMIEPCIKSVRKVFPEFVVLDIGSEDGGPEIARKLGCTVHEMGRMSGEEYTELKEDRSNEFDYSLWIDADEVWPEHSLENIKRLSEEYSVINGFWRNLDVRGKSVSASSYTLRGAVAWDTREFRIHRTWPREKLSSRSDDIKREDVQFTPSDPHDVFCWHGVLLNLSPLPDKKNRWKKRAERKDNFSSLEWTILSGMPFKYSDERILEEPKFVWYK